MVPWVGLQCVIVSWSNENFEQRRTYVEHRIFSDIVRAYYIWHLKLCDKQKFYEDNIEYIREKWAGMRYIDLRKRPSEYG